jgi:hypothetical protein
MTIYQLLDARRALRTALIALENAIEAERVRMLNSGEAKLVDGFIVYEPEEGLAGGGVEEEDR